MQYKISGEGASVWVVLFWRAYVHSPSRSLLSAMYVKGPIEKNQVLLLIATALISQGVGCRRVVGA